MPARALVLVATCLAVASCGPRADPGGTVPPDAARPRTPSRTASPAPGVVHLHTLPAQGVAIDVHDRDVVLLVDLGGRVVERLPGYGLAYANGSVPGVVVLTRGPATYRLDPARDALVLTGGDPGGLIHQDARVTGIRPPAGSLIDGTRAGSWRWDAPSPDGSMRLAQWSGECESPAVFLARAGQRPVSITGPIGVRRAVEAFALGWSFDGRAIVQLLESACGRGFPRAGVYAFSGPGDGDLVFATHGRAFARMWGPA